MENFQLSYIQSYFLILFGIGIILYAILKKNSKRDLFENGKKAEGIIFELRNRPIGTVFSNVKNIVIVRFVTDKLDWITGELKNDFPSFYSGQYKVGDKVDVLYDEKDPDNFIVVTKQSEKRAKIFAFFIGLILMLVGFFQLLKFI
ncbi:MAG TPA: DUF3592 domain-containing protein [Parafilimonas sp.]|nr:DUF3592 domain-containing protein [Parafilimonas sp.]